MSTLYTAKCIKMFSYTVLFMLSDCLPLSKEGILNSPLPLGKGPHWIILPLPLGQGLVEFRLPVKHLYLFP